MSILYREMLKENVSLKGEEIEYMGKEAFCVNCGNEILVSGNIQITT